LSLVKLFFFEGVKIIISGEWMKKYSLYPKLG